MRRFNLKIAIMRTGISQREFAEKNGVKEKRLSGIITGLFNQRPPEEKAIRKGLGLNDNNDKLFEMMK